MKTFEEGNWSNDVCPICKTQNKGKVVLVGIDGTESGNNIQAIQIHLDCIELRYNLDKKVIYQILEEAN